MKTYIRPSRWQRLRWAFALGIGLWRATRGALVEVERIDATDDDPGDVAARVRAAEERAGKPRRVVPN